MINKSNLFKMRQIKIDLKQISNKINVRFDGHSTNLDETTIFAILNAASEASVPEISAIIL